ncbi:MAG: tyrosine-protein phosphatase, partial [Bacteroidia bacterium]|nr:tyrosine-protein phosphatase [Bacteroidia bacterium]
MKNLFFLIVVSIAQTISTAQTQPGERPAKWATLVKSEQFTNLYKLNNDVYRSEQPDDKGFQELSKLGIKSVLNLREYHSDDDEAKGINLKLYHVEMEAEDIHDAEIAVALKILTEAPKPILIHCKYGSDRTGLVCAMYRIVIECWSKKEALDELINGGYGFHLLY